MVAIRAYATATHPRTCIERVAPDLVADVEITHADRGKAERYAEMGVWELWQLHGKRDSRELRAELLALPPGGAPRLLEASRVLEGLTPEDAREAVEGVQSGQTLDERKEAVTRIVRRRQQASIRVRDEEAPYPAPSERSGSANGRFVPEIEAPSR